MAILAMWLWPAGAAGEAPGGPVDFVARREAMRAKIRQTTARLEGQVPAEAYLRDARGNVTGVNKDHPGYRQLQEQWRAELAAIRKEHNVGDTRWDDLQRSIQEADVAGKVKNTGSRPGTLSSDIDFTEVEAGAGKQFAETLKGKKYTVTEKMDRWVVHETDTTIWKKGLLERIGSAAHQAARAWAAWAEDIFPTAGGQFKTSDGQVGVLDPEGAVLANAKKFSEGGGTLDPRVPEQLAKIDGHIVGKSVSKAADWTGTKTGDPEFFRKADALRAHQTWEESGVCDFGEPGALKARRIQTFLDQGLGKMERAAQAGAAQSRQIAAARHQEVLEARQQGNNDKALQLRQQQIEVDVSNEQTVRHLAENDPEVAARIKGTQIRVNGDGTFTDMATGKTYPASRLREHLTAGARGQAVKSIQTQLTEAATPPAETPPRPPQAGETPAAAEGAPAEAAGGRGQRLSFRSAAGFGLLVLMAYGAQGGVDYALDSAAPNDRPIKTFFRAWVYGLYHATGIPGAVDLGDQAGRESLEQFRRDVMGGQDPSVAWMRARGVLWGVGGFLRGLLIDPVIHGGAALREMFGFGASALEERQADAQARETLRRAQQMRREMEKWQAEVARIRVVIEPAGLKDAQVDKDYAFQARVENVPDWLKGLRYSWQFSDERTPHEGALAAGQGPAVTHKFKREGRYKVTLSLYGCLGRAIVSIAEASADAQVLPPAPTIVLAVRGGPWQTGQKVPLEAQVTGPPAKRAFEWSFGDGGARIGTWAPTVQHAFGRPGTYQVKVRLYDPATMAILAEASGSVVVAAPAAAAARQVKLKRTYHDAEKRRIREEYWYYEDGSGAEVRHGLYTEWQSDGKAVKRGNYKDGKMDGAWTTWGYNEPIQVGFGTPEKNTVSVYRLTYAKGVPAGLGTATITCNGQWPYKQYAYRQFPSRAEGAFVQYAVVNGKSVPYYRGTFKDGKMDGAWTVYWPDGKVQYERGYAMGMAQGEWKMYRQTGVLESVTEYRGDHANGKHVAYYPDGSVQKTGQYLNGESTGTWMDYYENGKVKSEKHIANGKRVGIWKEYYSSGNLKWATEYTDRGQVDRTGDFRGRN